MRWLLGLAVLLAASAGAQQPFEAVVAGVMLTHCINPFSSGRLQWVNPHHVERDGRVTDIASADGVTVFAVEDRSGPSRVVKITPDGSRVPFFTGPGDSITVAPTGRVFLATQTALTRVSAEGAQEAVFPLPGFTRDFFSVGPDGCTLYYSKIPALTRIARFNGCTGETLPDFPVSLPEIIDVLPLPNGDVLVADADGVRLYDAGGVLVRFVASLEWYGLRGLFPVRIAVSPDGKDLWIAAVSICGSPGVLLRVALSNGLELSRVETEITWADGLVVGAAPPATIAPIPTGTHPTLLLLALTLAAAAVFLLRR